MSGKGGGAAASYTAKYWKGSSGISGIPAGSRKMVQSLKEIVNCPESEIYAMLKECNMDPNEAVNRLLSQDPFCEVKSKREKKKENKETTDPRYRGANNTTHRGGRAGADRYGRGGSTQFSSNETGVSHAKPAYKKENGTHAYVGSSFSASGMAGNNINRRPQALHSDSLASENKMSTLGLGDGVSSSLQPPSGFQSPWLGVPGQVSMADIVKMGRPHNKASAMPPHHGVNHHYPAAPPLAASNHDLHLSENLVAKMSEIDAEPEVSASEHVHSNDEWPSIEQPTASSIPSVLEAPADFELYTDPSNLPLDRVNQHMNSQLDDVQPAEDGHVETLTGNHVGPASVSSRNVQEDSPVASSIFDNNLYGSSYQPPRHAFEHEAEDGASSVAANFQQLNLQSDDQGAPPEEACFSSRNPEYYGDEHLRNTADENLIHGPGMSPGNYDSPSVPQPEVLEETPEAAQVNQYAFPSSAPGYTYDNAQQLNAAFNNPQTSSQMPNVAPFSSVMQGYTNSLPSTLLASTVQPGREPDLPYSPFPVTQSMPTKYGNTASPISAPSMSMPEALRSGSISTPQPTLQTLPGASVAMGPTLPQHLTVHPYSQPTLPLGPFANMIGYPFLPQSYAYMPSAFQQTFAGNFPLNPPTAPGGTTIGYDDVLSSQYKDGNHLISSQQNENSAMWVHGPGSRTMSAVPASTYYSFQGQNQQPGGFRQGQQLSQHFGTLGYPNFIIPKQGSHLNTSSKTLGMLPLEVLRANHQSRLNSYGKTATKITLPPGFSGYCSEFENEANHRHSCG
ncbi:hypothetical protein GH714_043105 [Hevea brasiliensis]|uniref:GBF-interacting protein 1 N-terminal domain-containing protein n=1 Tax=Hevea brasiliensis TaxID=3981 RepID=A0A6A6K2U1_HEVBR|nr:hypothetical protein GH714_043105 [Hevea brasiliensis]